MPTGTWSGQPGRWDVTPELDVNPQRMARDIADLQTNVLALSRSVGRLTGERDQRDASFLARLRWLLSGRVDG